MDLSQTKLSKTEWEHIELPVTEKEHKILSLICRGFHDPTIQINENLSLFSFIKIQKTNDNEIYLYRLYFESLVSALLVNAPTPIAMPLTTNGKDRSKQLPKKIDLIRIEHLKQDIETNQSNIVEFFLLDFAKEMLLHLGDNSHHFYLYTLMRLRHCTIQEINVYVYRVVYQLVDCILSRTSIRDMVFSAEQCIEKNPYLLRYEDLKLFSHQKQLFELFNQEGTRTVPSLVLYTAPTGTGKTLSPLGLSEGYRVIFVCVARHIGLSLAKSAVSMKKRVGFAFGCETAADIRLHNFAAAEYTRNYKTGGIFKVDNSNGRKVDIMICDVKSYLIAMYYMLAFHSELDIVTYWDEPTITLDYEDHELHEYIHNNWVHNKISKVVLSCATLPREDEIATTLLDFRNNFEGAVVHNIQSYDCKKTISLVNTQGRCIMPHILFRRYQDVLKCVEHCFQHKTLLRYLDLAEIIRFIKYVENEMKDTHYSVVTKFKNIESIDMFSLKTYYLDLLQNLDPSTWTKIHEELRTTQCLKISSSSNNNDLRKIKSEECPLSSPHYGGKPISKHYSINGTEAAAEHSGWSGSILLTTRDAHTLTDGPTIYIVEDVMKIGKFYIQQSNIPECVFHSLLETISKNNVVQKKMSLLEHSIEDELGKEAEKEKKMEREHFTANVRRLKTEWERLQGEIEPVVLNPLFVPNTRQHQEKWIGRDRIVHNAFVPQIDEEHMKRIMMLDVDTQKKILLLLGIGVFVRHPCVAYMEIMKQLAYEQKLFLIIASSDYIYGTNYQFCHGFLGKDLVNMTQQKTMQAMGRIGRNNIQQHYTIRFRDDSIATRLFLPPNERNREAIKMAELFST